MIFIAVVPFSQKVQIKRRFIPQKSVRDEAPLFFTSWSSTVPPELRRPQAAPLAAL
ncbi:MAG TPA: hypothetical protein H9703_00510 [Candidatus Faecalibacterium faecigallinarum]|uniref:Uncharacterized protein n=1 Tax=Candidatus Faecalibacterium faecigallinarum TaxID=2838577 RepID=A0A9D2P5F1_9FIRM|nr:hypothetical protein [Candidatus Faecalibacterium faecigallinarum]